MGPVRSKLQDEDASSPRGSHFENLSNAFGFVCICACSELC